jgi:hypothetical protein
VRFRVLICGSGAAAFLLGYYFASTNVPGLGGVKQLVRGAGAAGEIAARNSIIGTSGNSNVRAAVAALEEKDALRRDHLLYLAIEEMNGADFEALFSDLRALWKQIKDLPSDTQQWLLEAVAERWLSIDAAGALRWLDGGVFLMRLTEKTGETIDVQQFTSLFTVLARHQPEWMMKHLEMLGDSRFPWGPRPQAIREIVLTAAKRDRAEASRWVDRFPADQQAAWNGLVSGISESSPMAALELALTQKHKPFFDELARISVQAAAKDGPATVQRLLDCIDDARVRRAMVWAAVQGLADYSPTNPLAWFATQIQTDPKLITADSYFQALWGLARRAPMETADLMATIDSAQRGFFLSTVLHAWSDESPDQPMAWLGKQAAGLLQNSASLVDILQTISRGAPEQFENWFSTLPEGELRSAAENVGAVKLIEWGRVDEALNLATPLLPHDADGTRVAQIAFHAARRDPSATAAWLAGVPDGKVRQHAAEMIGRNWGAKDPKEAAAWVESLPFGDARDRAIGGYASAVASADPATAGEWLERIDNPTVKERAAGYAFSIWSAEDPINARRFLRGLTGVSDDWKEEMLRRVR